MQTVFAKSELRWHLTNNIVPALNQVAITRILELVDRFNEGEIELFDVDPGTGLEVAEIFEDLRIDVTDELMLEYDDEVNDNVNSFNS
jgi:hypothetical protein